MMSRGEIIIGIGCDRGTSQRTLEVAIDRALALAGRRRDAVAALATIDGKRDEPALLALSAQRGWQIYFYSAVQLAEVKVPNPSETVLRHMGTPAVSEAAAMLAAGGNGNLILEKQKYRGDDHRNVTVSIVGLGN